MTIVVCPLRRLDAQIVAHRPARVITLLAPDGVVPSCPTIAPDARLTLLFHDIVTPMDGHAAPDVATIGALLAFTADWDAQAPLLVHCWAGISRSPAAAYIIACQHAAPGREADIAVTFRAASPWITPNKLMVAIADEVLQRDGRMSRAIAEIGRGADCGEGATFAVRQQDTAWMPVR